jgi:hypothetical protein
MARCFRASRIPAVNTDLNSGTSKYLSIPDGPHPVILIPSGLPEEGRKVVNCGV